MTTQEKILELQNKVISLPYTARAIFTNVTALQNVWLDKKAAVLLELSHHPKPNPLDIPNSTNHSYSLIISPLFTEIATLRLTLEVAQASQEYIAAAAVIQPMLDLLAALEAQLAAENDHRASKHRDLRDAEEAALEAAKLAALNSPEVIAARRALESLDQPQPTKKGKAMIEDTEPVF